MDEVVVVVVVLVVGGEAIVNAVAPPRVAPLLRLPLPTQPRLHLQQQRSHKVEAAVASQPQRHPAVPKPATTVVQVLEQVQVQVVAQQLEELVVHQGVASVVALSEAIHAAMAMVPPRLQPVQQSPRPLRLLLLLLLRLRQL